MEPSTHPSTLGVIEVGGFTAAVAALDAARKASGVTLIQAELNDLLGLAIKVEGVRSAVQVALDAAEQRANELHATAATRLLDQVTSNTWHAAFSPPDYNPLLNQDVVLSPQEIDMAESVAHSLGFIETQGFTAAFAAIDAACKAADVEVVGKEKLGGGYIAIVVRGDIAAVKAAVEAGAATVDSLGKLIAAHVIARPSDSVLALLPRP